MIQITYNDLVEARKAIERFKKPKTNEEMFYNLMFCLMVPQSTFKNCVVVLDKLKEFDFYNASWTEDEVRKIIKPCRFFRRKAEYLIGAKKDWADIYDLLIGPFTNEFRRTWLVKNVKGLGMKAASHLLRNLGVTDFAIVDTHILKYLRANGKKWNYLELEEKLRKRAKRYFISLAELDVIIWKHYSKTSWESYTY